MNIPEAHHPLTTILPNVYSAITAVTLMRVICEGATINNEGTLQYLTHHIMPARLIVELHLWQVQGLTCQDQASDRYLQFLTAMDGATWSLSKNEVSIRGFNQDALKSIIAPNNDEK